MAIKLERGSVASRRSVKGKLLALLPQRLEPHNQGADQMTIATKMTGITRHLAAGIAVLTAVMGSLFVSAPAAQAASNYKITASLEARDIEDWWPDDTDEISVNFNGSQVFFAGMKQNQPKTLATDHEFADFLRVTVYEWDRGTPRNLGEQYVSVSSLNSDEDLQFGV